jgi:hypothetical protein
LWQALLLTGIAGFGTAVGVHPIVGYNSFSHLAPAFSGVVMFTAGMIMTFPGMCGELIDRKYVFGEPGA